MTERFIWQPGDLERPEAACEACGRGVVDGPLCEDCMTTIDRDYERMRDELDLWGPEED